MGTAPAVGGRPGLWAFTSFQLSSAGSFAKLGGSLPAGDHGPFKSDAVSHVSLLRRYSVFEGVSKRSQFVFTANLTLNRTPYRVTVQVHEHCGSCAEKDLGRVLLLCRLWRRACLRDRRCGDCRSDADLRGQNQHHQTRERGELESNRCGDHPSASLSAIGRKRPRFLHFTA
jgi:hypothetical protein